MEECYVLLGIHPMADTDEIERAYQEKMRAFDPKQFEEGSAEWKDAVAMRESLKQAYDAAIMATFAPIRASAPATSHSSHPNTQATAPRPTVPDRISPPLQQAPRPPRPEGYAMGDAAPVRSTWTPPPPKDPDLEGLVEEVPVSFSDEDLLNMDISQLRETYAPPQKERSMLPTLGIEDPLLRSYVWMFLLFVLLDFIMRLLMGNAWSGMHRALDRMAGLLPEGGTDFSTPPPPSVLWSFATSFVSMFYIFICSLIAPIAVRFFFLGEPVVDKKMTRWMMDLASIAPAWLITIPAGLLFRILPAEWAGSPYNLLFVTPLLCDITLRYRGR